MKKVLGIIAIAVSLIGGANFALAQSNPTMGVTTGSEANADANAHGGKYREW
jgi:hypothetical protein